MRHAAGDTAEAGAVELTLEQARPMPLSGSLRCEAGELTALVGPSGAGKTSMLRVMAGLMRPAQGRMQVGGQWWMDTAHGLFLAPQARRVGLVFQHYALMPHLSALDNVALALLHLPGPERLRVAAGWLEKVHLTGDVLQRRPADLSGGQQQRVAVARALAREPRLLLLDEPFSATDSMNRQALYALLAELRRALNVPIVLVTHDLAEARLLADRLVVMDAGCVLQQGTPQAVYQSPRNARVADLVGIQNRFRGTWEGPAGLTGQGRLRWLVDPRKGTGSGPVLEVVDKGRIQPGQEVTWIVPGDAIALHEPVDGPLGPGQFHAAVEQSRHLGETTLASLRLSDWPPASLSLSVSGMAQRQLLSDARLVVELDLSRIHVMPRHARA